MAIYNTHKARPTHTRYRPFFLLLSTKLLLRFTTISVLVLLFMMMQEHSVIAGTGNKIGPNHHREKKPIGGSSNPNHSFFFGDSANTNDNNRNDDYGGDNSDDNDPNATSGPGSNEDSKQDKGADPNPPPFIVDIYTEHEFIEYCHYYFKQYTGKNDGRETNSRNNARNGKFISQDDYANFFFTLCNTFHDEDVPTFHCPNPTFNELDTTLQLLFVTDICSGMDRDNNNIEDAAPVPNDGLGLCLNALILSNAAFGYHHHSDNTDNNGDVVSMMFDDICCELLEFMILVGLDPDDTGCSVAPSPQPTMNPSPSPFEYYTTMIPTPSPELSTTPQEDDKPSSTDVDDGASSNNSNIVVVPSTGSSINGNSGGGDGSSSNNKNDNIRPTTVVDNDFDNYGRYKNKLRAATIVAGITLGAGGLCLIGMGSSRRFFFSLPSSLQSMSQQQHLANMYSPYSSSSSQESSALPSEESLPQQQQQFPNHHHSPPTTSTPHNDFDDDSISDMNDSIM